MKHIDGIWAQLTSFENLLQAYRQARLGKHARPAVAEFGFHLEQELFALQRELWDGSFRPSSTQTGRSAPRPDSVPFTN